MLTQSAAEALINIPKIKNRTLILTDDGYTIRDLELSGFDIGTEKRIRLLRSILNGFGVRLQGDEIIVEAKTENFGNDTNKVVRVK
jgi:hypothetical protein